jgi:hypothetical protein
MTRRTIRTVIAALLTLFVGVAHGQTRPDFSGTWRLDEKRSGSPGYAEFVGPVQWVIHQTPDSMVVEITAGSEKTTYTYELYDARPTAPAGANSFRGYFEGARLTTESNIDIKGKTVTMREARTLSPDGREMMVERVVAVEHGYDIKGVQNYSNVKDVFVRVVPND